MGEFHIYPTGRKADKTIKEYGLGPEGIAKITFMGTGILAPKSENIIRKSKMLERLGFIFPRRNLVISSNVLAEGIVASGSKEMWKAGRMRNDGVSREAFKQWSDRNVWPVVEGVFEGRHLYVRSDAFGDSLGRGAYESVPFPNRQGEFSDEDERKRAFSNALFQVLRSYFSDTANAFRKAGGIVAEGMNILLSQFVGEPSSQRFNDKRILMPFMGAVVKTSLFSQRPGKGLVRFEYGMGKGAISGRSILVDNGRATQTIVGRSRKEGVYCSWIGTKVTGLDLKVSNEIELDDTKWAVLNSILSGAYPTERGKGIEQHAKELLTWLAERLPKLQEKNGGPLYLELISSSFQNRLRWFVVQAADYPPMHEIPEPPKYTQFYSNTDFSGHGEVKGERKVFLFQRDAFEGESTKKTLEKLSRINDLNQEFVLILPQEALSGMNLVEMSGTYFSNAAAVIEYQSIGDEFWKDSVHQSMSSEHFEQLARDFDMLFIPVEKLRLEGVELGKSREPLSFNADVHLACDRERQIGWGSIRNPKL